MRILVTGSGTGVGKTFVTSAIGSALAETSAAVIAIKPVESGVGSLPLAVQDGALLSAATGQTEPRLALTTLRDPLAPPVAADREGSVLDWTAWISYLEGVSADFLLVEGAGGLLSPLTWSKTSLDLALELAAPVLLVAKDKLGVLNSVLLTITVAVNSGVEVLGVVLSEPAVPDESTGTNAAALERVLRARGLPQCPFGIISLPFCESAAEGRTYLQQLTNLLVDSVGK